MGPSKNAKVSPNSKPTPTPKPVVLIAEDDDISRFLIKSMLEKEGFVAVTAENGKVAIELFRNNPSISVVFMDLKMPVMNGLEATKHIKKMSPHTPVVAATAFAFWYDEAQLSESGFDSFIPKPFDSRNLSNTLKNLNLK
jgi:CheY-like chemotaxis protein